MLGGRNIYNDPYESKMEEFIASIPFLVVFGIAWVFYKLGLFKEKQ